MIFGTLRCLVEANLVAPWVNAINDRRIEEEGGRSLLAIQQEEEQRMNEERHQSRVKESVSPANAVWGSSAAQKLSWNQPTQVCDLFFVERTCRSGKLSRLIDIVCINRVKLLK